MKWNTLYSSRIDSMGHSDVAAMLKLAERPDVISFAGGLPDPAIFLLEEIKEVFEEVLAQRGRAALGYGPTAGIAPFREWLAEHMTQSGRASKVDECLVTTGGIAALDLICKVLLDPGDLVIVGEPAYLAALHVIKSYQGRFAGVPLDDKGMQSDALKSTLEDLQRESLRPKFIYLVPSFQNPTGVTLSEKRRKRIVEIAVEYNVPIIEDAAYRDLRFEDQAPPLLASLDPQNVIHINTFSKIFNPGVRIGWVTAPQKVTSQKVHTGQNRKEVFIRGLPYQRKLTLKRFCQDQSRTPQLHMVRVQRSTTIAAEKNTCGCATVTCLTHKLRKVFVGLHISCPRSWLIQNINECACIVVYGSQIFC